MIDPRYKTFWARVGAGLVDTLVLWPLALVSTWIYRHGGSPALTAVWFVFAASANGVYEVWMLGRFGQTVGKMVTGIKVIDSSERRGISYGQAFRRHSVAIVLIAISVVVKVPSVLDGVDPYARTEITFASAVQAFGWLVWFLAELVTMLTNARRRAVHDLIGGTVVVRLRDGVHVAGWDGLLPRDR